MAQAALKALESIAGYVLGRIQLKKLNATEFKLITNLLKEVKSISSELWRDVDAYINKTPATLLALKAVGGTENMPPLPATPGTTG